jgi:4-amino-4-deoxy-L-arabinose transferase-like glycosyltransferase
MPAQLAVPDHRPSSIGNLQSAVCNLCLLALCVFLFFHRLADRDLWSSHEGRAAQDAQSILDDGAWGLPRLFDRQVELQKPPLYYWLVAGLARWRGGTVDAWAVRLPAALAALGTVLLVYLLGCWHGRPVAGLVAALVLATAHHYTWLARVGRIDMPLALTVTVALGPLCC